MSDICVVYRFFSSFIETVYVLTALLFVGVPLISSVLFFFNSLLFFFFFCLELDLLAVSDLKKKTKERGMQSRTRSSLFRSICEKRRNANLLALLLCTSLVDLYGMARNVTVGL